MISVTNEIWATLQAGDSVYCMEDETVLYITAHAEERGSPRELLFEGYKDYLTFEDFCEGLGKLTEADRLNYDESVKAFSSLQADELAIVRAAAVAADPRE